MGGITCNAEGFAGETGAVDVLEGGERDTNDLLSCSHYPLKGLAAGPTQAHWKYVSLHTFLQQRNYVPCSTFRGSFKVKCPESGAKTHV